MKDIFSKYKVGFLITIVVFVVMASFTTARFILAEKAVKQAINDKKQNFTDSEINDAGWEIPEIEHIKKEIYWLERQLLLAKSDSLNLGINLSDSILQVQLKGTVLHQANILKQYPANFIESPNYAAYLDFTAITKIVDEQSTIRKRPVKKVQAPKNENEVAEVKHDTIPDPRIVWQFVLDNKTEVVITGVGLGPDSIMDMNFERDILKYNAEKIKTNWLPKSYMPTIYIWLNDKDAKAIYRAIPENGKVVFRI